MSLINRSLTDTTNLLCQSFKEPQDAVLTSINQFHFWLKYTAYLFLLCILLLAISGLILCNYTSMTFKCNMLSENTYRYFLCWYMLLMSSITSIWFRQNIICVWSNFFFQCTSDGRALGQSGALYAGCSCHHWHSIFDSDIIPKEA